MYDTQNKTYKLHGKSITFILNAISFKDYDKITNTKSTKTMYDSLFLTKWLQTHEGEGLGCVVWKNWFNYTKKFYKNYLS